MSMTKEEIIKEYEMAVEGGELIAPFMGEDEKKLYEMLKAGLSALRPITREQVEKERGEWKCHGDCGVTECSACGWNIEEYVGNYSFCPACGAPMTDEAVDMVMERLEEVYASDT